MYMYIHEELFGKPGRRQEEMIGKAALGTYEPEEKRRCRRKGVEKTFHGRPAVVRADCVLVDRWSHGKSVENHRITIAQDRV